jgi:hypothetical protein
MVAKPLLQEARNSETIPKTASDHADSDMALMKRGNYPNSVAKPVLDEVDNLKKVFHG